jgi:hypothetical protein
MITIGVSSLLAKRLNVVFSDGSSRTQRDYSTLTSTSSRESIPSSELGPPPPPPTSECVSPATLPWGERKGGPNSDDWKESLALCDLEPGVPGGGHRLHVGGAGQAGGGGGLNFLLV